MQIAAMTFYTLISYWESWALINFIQQVLHTARIGHNQQKK